MNSFIFLVPVLFFDSHQYFSSSCLLGFDVFPMTKCVNFHIASINWGVLFHQSLWSIIFFLAVLDVFFIKKMLYFFGYIDVFREVRVYVVFFYQSFRSIIFFLAVIGIFQEVRVYMVLRSFSIFYQSFLSIIFFFAATDVSPEVRVYVFYKVF